MDCTEIRSRLTDFDEGTLGSDEWDSIQAHLKECATCNDFHGRLNEAWTALDQLPVAEPDPFAQRQFLARFGRKKFWINPWLNPLKSLGTAAALAILIFGFAYIRHAPRQNLRTAAISGGEDYPSFFTSSQFFPDPTSGYSRTNQASDGLSSFSLGSIQGPFQETAIYNAADKEDTP